MCREGKYYYAYEDRYRRVYAQGVEYWTNEPAELESTIQRLEGFLDYYGLSPDDTRLIEFGCGEGHFARHLIRLGYDYLGVDVSPTAIRKAEQRVGEAGLSGKFLVADITDLPMIADGSYDACIDNSCLQMLVLDADRRAYLAEAARILTDDGKAYFHDGCRRRGPEGGFKTFDEYLEGSGEDLVTLEDRQAYAHGKHCTIRLPRVPARSNTAMGYRSELARAGLIVEKLEDRRGGGIIYARKSRAAPETGD